MKHYMDVEVAEITNLKMGVVREFKKILKNQGLIGNHQQLPSTFIEIFHDAAKYKENTSATWSNALIHILSERDMINNETNESDQKPLSEQIKSILELHDNGVLDQAQAFEVIRNLV